LVVAYFFGATLNAMPPKCSVWTAKGVLNSTRSFTVLHYALRKKRSR